VPRGGQWVTFLRNHDELDLSRLTDTQRSEVFAAFAPEEHMRLYGRGIRRRLAPMLGNDRRRIELAYALQFSLPGTPALRYGEEIGMGDDLALKGRDAFRTPMQWEDRPGAGFSRADPQHLVKPLIDDGEYGYPEVNVARQRADRDSLLAWMQRLINVRRECPENGEGTLTLVDGEGVPPEVLVHRVDGLDGSLVFLHNFSDQPQVVDLTKASALEDAGDVQQLFADGDGSALGDRLGKVDLPGYGYRWIRLMR
jgi:maltose alpha-D-glucosyltransferase/alpha-amylase